MCNLDFVIRSGAKRAAVVRAGGEQSGIFGFAAAPVRCNFSFR